MAANPRLLCVYQHAPTPGAPGIYRHRMLLAELVRRGWHVDLVSSPINYMTGQVTDAYRGKWYVHEVIDGIDHHWVRASGDVHRSKKKRAQNYVTFASSATLRGARLPRPDVIWASSPPLSIASVGATLARRFRRPWIYEVRDLWPESAAAVGWLSEESKAYKALDRLARRYARGAAKVIVPTPGLIEPVKSHGAKDISVITGAIVDRPPREDDRIRERSHLNISDDECVFAYVGAHGAANGLDMLLDAAERLADTPARFVLAGDGGERPRLEREVASRNLNNVQLLGPRPKDDIPALLSAADVSLHMLRPDPLFASALPTKVLEYFGAHRAFITTVPGLPEKLAIESGGGFAPNETALVDEIRRWLAMSPAQWLEHGERSFEYGMAQYGLNAVVDKLEETLFDTIRK